MLRRRLRAATAGVGQAVLIRGDAGVGKTRLTADFVHEAEVGRVRVFRVNRRERGGGPPGASELVETIQKAALRSPVIVFVDDVDLVDAETATALHTLLSEVRASRVLMLFTAGRDRGRTATMLAEEVEAQKGLIVELGPLEHDLAESLVASLVEGRPDSALREYCARAAGNPLLLTALLGALKQDAALMSVDGFVTTSSTLPPVRFREVVRARFAHLQNGARELLQAASIFGTSFPPAELAVVTGKTAFEILTALEEPISIGLIVESGASLSFRYPLVRDAIYFDIPLPIRTQLHGDVARALHESGAPATHIAAHLSYGADEGDDAAVTSLRRAAASADTSPSAAVSYLERALEVGGEQHGQRGEIFTELTLALIAAGRLGEAEAAARTALLRHGTEPDANRLRIALSQTLLLQGRLNESIRELESAAAAAAIGSAHQLELVADASYREMLAGNLDKGTAQARTVVEASGQPGAELAGAMAQVALAHSMFYRGYFSEAVELTRPALAIAKRLGSADVSGIIDADLGVFLIHADQGAEAAAVLRHDSHEPSDGAAWQAPRHHYAAGYRYFYSGAWDEAVREFEEGLSLATDLHVAWWGPAVRSSLASIYVHRDELRRAASVLDALGPDIDTSSPDGSADYVLAARASIAEANGDRQLAVALISQAACLIEAWGLPARYRRIATDLVRLDPGADTDRHARLAVEALETVASRANVPSARGMALLARGMHERDADLLLEAASTLSRRDHPLELGTAYEEAAVVLGTGRASDASLAHFEEALRVYSALGARRDSARARARMRRLGIRIGPRERHRPTGRGWDSITAAEHEVIRLLAEGLSNAEIAARLFVSRRTVEAHLAVIFGKLGVSGRLAVAVRAGERRSGQD